MPAYYSSSSESVAVFSALFIIVVGVLILIAFLVSTSQFINVARMKGYFRETGAGWLWFVGIFATPIVVGLYVVALPDKTADGTASSSSSSSELPAL